MSARRLPVLSVMLIISACGDGATDPGGSSEPTSPQQYTISGVVEDSVLGKVLAGVVVSVGSKSDTTDALGRYAVTLDEGTVTLTVGPVGYELYTRSVQLSSNQTLDVQLRRLAPWVQALSWFATSSEIMVVTIGDLRGGASIDQSSVTAFAEGPGFGNLIFSGGQQWQQAGALTWTVTLLGSSAPTRVTWNAPDQDGNAARFLCLAGASCQEETEP